MDGYAFSWQFIKNALSGPVKIVITTAIVFFSYRYFLQSFGVEKYSVWLLLATVIDFCRLGNLGVSDVIIKYSAEARAANDRTGFCRFATAGLIIIVFFTSVFIVPVALIEGELAAFLCISPDFLLLFDSIYDKVLLLSFLLIVQELFYGILFGVGRADLANYLQSAGTFFGTSLAMGLVYLDFDLLGLYWGNFAAAFLILGCSLFFIYKELGFFPFRISYFKLDVAKQILNDSLSMFASSIINLFFLPAGKVLLARYIGNTEVVAYDLAFKLGFQIRALFDLGLKALVSELSAMSQDKAKIKILLIKTYKYLAALSLPVIFLVLFFSEELLRFWLGMKYMQIMNDSFRIIMLGFFVNLFAVPAYYLLMSYGQFRKLLGGVIIQSVVAFSLGMIYFLILDGRDYFVFLYGNVIAMIVASVYLIFFMKKISGNLKYT